MIRINNRTPSNNPLNAVAGLLILVVVLVTLFMLARFVFQILAFLSPVLIIAALVLDYKTVTGFGKWLIDLVRRNALMGIAAIVLTVLGFPLVSAFLAGKALLSRNVRKAREEQEPQKPGEYIDFEELDDRPLELPELSKMKRREEERREEERREKDRREKEPPPPRREDRDRDRDYDQLFD